MLKKNTPYMVRNNGTVLECGDAHPYVVYDIKDNLSEIIDNIIYGNTEWLFWFYRNTLQNHTKKKIIQCVQYLSNILLFFQENKIDSYLWMGELKDISTILKFFNIRPKHISEVTPSTLKNLEALFRELNNLTNQEFLRCRTGGEYWEEDSEEIYFRISSTDFNWFDIIWKIVFDNKNIIENVTIEPDRQSGKNIGKMFYIVGGIPIDHIPTDIFLTLKGKPVIESADTDDVRILKLREGKSLIESFGDFGPFHNNNKFEIRRNHYLREAFCSCNDAGRVFESGGEQLKSKMTVQELLKELGINRAGTRSGDTYTIDLTNSNDFGRITSILDGNDSLEPIDESSYITPDNANLDYKYGDDFILSAIADFENDYYQLVITDMGD